MLFLNEYEIGTAEQAFDTYETPNLSAAAQTLTNLARYANENSDGWAYWSKPKSAAKALMTQIQHALVEYHRGGVVDDTTGPHLSKVYTPIKSFLTREGVDWRTIIVAPE
jgi:hypothetical protein